MILEIDPEGSGQFDFATFITLMTRRLRDDDTFEELLEVNLITLFRVSKCLTRKVLD